MGTNCCFLCNSGVDFVEQLFVQCVFGQNVWEVAGQSLHFLVSSRKKSLEDNILLWVTNYYHIRARPLFFPWGNWRGRNLVIFEIERKCVSFLSSQISGTFLEYQSEQNLKATRNIIFPSMLNYTLVGFFYGASQLGIFGCGIVSYVVVGLVSILNGWVVEMDQ